MTNCQVNTISVQTEQREESLPLRHMRDGRLGYTLGCTPEGETVQVRLVNGELDSWSRDECMESF